MIRAGVTSGERSTGFGRGASATRLSGRALPVSRSFVSLAPSQLEVAGRGQGREGRRHREISFLVPAGLVQEVDGAERPLVPDDGHVEHGLAAEREDQLVVEEDGADVVGRPPHVRPPLAKKPLRPCRRCHRLTPAHRIGRGLVAVVTLRLRGVGMIDEHGEELVTDDGAHGGIESREERMGLAGLAAGPRDGDQVRQRICEKRHDGGDTTVSAAACALYSRPSMIAAVLAWCLLVSVLVEPAWPQDQPPPPPPIPVPEISARSEEIVASLKTLDERLAVSAELANIEARLPAMTGRIQRQLIETQRLLDSEPPLAVLANLADAWRGIATDIAAWSDLLTSEAIVVQGELDRLNRLAGQWSRRREWPGRADWIWRSSSAATAPRCGATPTEGPCPGGKSPPSSGRGWSAKAGSSRNSWPTARNEPSSTPCSSWPCSSSSGWVTVARDTGAKTTRIWRAWPGSSGFRSPRRSSWLSPPLSGSIRDRRSSCAMWSRSSCWCRSSASCDS